MAYLHSIISQIFLSIKSGKGAELIYVCRAADNHDKITGQYRNKINNYGRYHDKEYIQKYAEAREDYLSEKNGYTYTRPSVKQGNENRQLTQLYNSLVSGKMYSNNKIQQIYDHIFEKNERTLEKMRNHKSDDNFKKVQQIYEDEWRDEVIFDQFSFLKRKEHEYK